MSQLSQYTSTDMTSASLSFPGVSWSNTCNGSDRAICMQQPCRPPRCSV